MRTIKIYSILFLLLTIPSAVCAGGKKRHGRCLKEVIAERRDSELFEKFKAHIGFETVELSDSDFKQEIDECVSALDAVNLIDNALCKQKKRQYKYEQEEKLSRGYTTQDMLDIIAGQTRMKKRLEEKMPETISYQTCSSLIRNLSKEKLEIILHDQTFQIFANQLLSMRASGDFKEISHKLRAYFKKITQTQNIITADEIKALRLILHEKLLITLINRMIQLKIDNRKIKQLKYSLICSYHHDLLNDYKKFLIALHAGDASTIIELLKKGMLIDWFVSETGFSVLSFLINHKSEPCFPLIKIVMLCPDLDINMQTTEGNTALIFAVRKSSLKATQLLLEETDYQENDFGEFQEVFGIDIDKQNKHGETALIVAAKNNNTEIARLLVHHGANKKLKNRGSTAYDYAQQHGNQELIALLNPEL